MEPIDNHESDENFSAACDTESMISYLENIAKLVEETHAEMLMRKESLQKYRLIHDDAKVILKNIYDFDTMVWFKINTFSKAEAADRTPTSKQ